ncbi:hypothetical protein RHMOL_Rhmol13G0057400 [Rhododendron molle]|uniref:Uncharacterized protein n=1 Tax=Rhododendron molle TaxID=49168 RepID=A0ACC0L3C0_RHOML|nr:hypothetical protein RHMOL_Rhmol13G0057400 [Rhododendron molle]
MKIEKLVNRTVKISSFPKFSQQPYMDCPRILTIRVCVDGCWLEFDFVQCEPSLKANTVTKGSETEKGRKPRPTRSPGILKTTD